MSAPPALLTERRNATLVLTLNRPRQANALTLLMQQEAAARITEASADTETAAVVIGGGTGSVFCAGADMREPPVGPPAAFREHRSAAMFDLLRAVADCRKPVVAALNGHAVGSGALLALVADGRVAAPGATLSLPEIAHGQPTFAGLEVVTNRLDRVLAGDMVQTGRRMDAAEAELRDLISCIAPAEELAEAALALAATLCRQPRAFALNKEWLNRGLADALHAAQERSTAARAATTQSDDEKESQSAS